MDERTGILSAASEGVYWCGGGSGGGPVPSGSVSWNQLGRAHVQGLFSKVSLPPFSLVSLLPTTRDGSTQNSILNCPLGYSSCRRNIYSTEPIIFLSKRASLPVLLTSR